VICERQLVATLPQLDLFELEIAGHSIERLGQLAKLVAPAYPHRLIPVAGTQAHHAPLEPLDWLGNRCRQLAANHNCDDNRA
jgi:hypothetical protein